MQFQRILLFIALGLLLMMIWQEWLLFKAEKAAPPESSAVAQPQSATRPDLTEDVPDAPQVAVPAADEQTAASNDLPNLAEGAAAGQIISVKTDLMHVEIDTLGGDIVRVDLLQHPVSIDTPDIPFTLMHRTSSDLYVAQSGLIGKERSYPNHNVEFTPENTRYELGADDQVEVAMHWTAPDGVQYTKVFRFSRDSYVIGIDFLINNTSDTQWVGFPYGQLRQTEIAQPGSMGFLGRLPSYSGAVIYTQEDKYSKTDYADIRDEKLSLITDSGWVAMLQHYFVSAWLPDEEAGAVQLYSGFTGAERPQYRIGYNAARPTTIAPGQQGRVGLKLYTGPKEQKRLDAQNVEGLKLTVDYGWLTPVANPLFWLLQKIHSFTNNWGWAIILLTVLVKAVFYPLSATSYKSMAKMKKLQPRMATLKERYSNDKQKFQQEMMKLYKSEKVNPAGGCLPILIQIPVFIALYWVLLESVELRQANFMGWLNDLSLPDPYFVLPIVMGASMLAQHFLNPAPVDPIQKKIMLALPFVFTIFFLWFPAGLVLYWVVNNLLSIAQQYYITRKYTDA